ncbi:MAG: aspartate carbamoyltransferase catalytic subunit [Helicobacter sp.]|nr:aspartate carbamoyltransferase catalytic subunit [Helicobacter sp.]
MPHLIQCDALSKEDVANILHNALAFKRAKNANEAFLPLLRGKNIIFTFFENSTRTLSSFEIAAHNLGANVIKLDVSRSSTNKGESLKDTILNLNAMRPDALVIRHNSSGSCNFLQKHVDFALINAGDGANAHPTQALLDLATIISHVNPAISDLDDIKDALKALEGKSVAIVGDIRNSRVANSNIFLLQKFGVKIRLIAPGQFLPDLIEERGLSFSNHLDLEGIDIVISLRAQVERHSSQTYGSLRDYAKDFCITREVIKDRDILLLHPGPVNQDIDISQDLANDPRYGIFKQVENGVFTRMAVFLHCLEISDAQIGSR